MMGARLVAAFALIFVAGCSHPPLVSLGDRVCDTTPRLTPGNDVSLGRSLTVEVDATTACLETSKGRASYVVFALPPAAAAYQITVRSLLRGGALISPEATIYGVDDRPRRDIGAFRMASSTFVASARGEPADRYVVVSSTPETVGQSRSIPTAANQTPIRLAATVIIPIIIPSTPVGPRTGAISAVLAHSGAITVTAAPFVTMP